MMLSPCFVILLLCLYSFPTCSFHMLTAKSRTQSNTVHMKLEAIVTEEEDWAQTFELIKDNLFLPATPQSLDTLSKQIDSVNPNSREFRILKLSRQNLLSKMLENDRNQYLDIVSQYGNRIPRSELPNRQEVSLSTSYTSTVSSISTSYLPGDSTSTVTIADCKLPNQTYTDSILDKFLLAYFRRFVQDEVKFKSPLKGIRGLLDEGRHYMLSSEGTPENQQRFVRKVLGRLFTPILPPFYRVFMSGIVPCKEKNDPAWMVQLTDDIRSSLPESWKTEFSPGRQFGPWFYAPFLTSFVTPIFLTFLVGPSSMNRRKDGSVGGMVVEKCKFLQESGCKGLCLHQCKLPAQQFFVDTLGLPLTVSPNFETQECQWSFGEVPLDPVDDPTFPSGCLAGCASRSQLKDRQRDQCSTISVTNL